MSLYAELIQGLAVERIVIGLFSPDGERVRVRGLSIVTLNSIQSRIIERIAKGGINLKLSELVGDSGSNLDYSGGRKTHRFPPPYGLGSLSLTIALPKIQPV